MKHTAPFAHAELVIATHPATLKGNKFKYGQLYRVRCEWKEWYNKHHHKWITRWYVGLLEEEDCYYTPELFSSLEFFKVVSYSEVEEVCAN